MSINHEEIRMHRLPIYRVTLVREGFQSLVMNIVLKLRAMYLRLPLVAPVGQFIHLPEKINFQFEKRPAVF